MPRCHALLILVLLAMPVHASANPAATPHPDRVHNGGPRVRPYDPRSAALLVEGLRRSERLRSLVTELEHYNVITYVQIQPGLKGRLAGSLTWVTATEEFRYVRISMSPDLRGAAAIATLAHELQHALEVAQEPSIVDAASLMRYYKEHGISMSAHRNGFDSEAARLVGDEVRQDLASAGHAQISESLQQFDPDSWPVVYRRARESGR